MQIKKISDGCIAITQSTPDSLTADWFTKVFWQQRDAITGSSRGRYITWFMQHDAEQWVLRHYYRGGLIEKLSKDTYLFTGYHRTRAIAELALLEQLFNEGFAVPEPVAALVKRHGIQYRADIIIKRVEGAEDLVARLSKTEMTTEQWQNLGASIAKFHRRGVYHADLNAKNILIANDQFYLIDFDRGELRSPASKWQQSNLERLLRSFNKEKSKQSALCFTEKNWQSLLAGYQKTV